MDKKRIVVSAVVFLILAILVYLQYRHWQSFDWGTFWTQTHRINKFQVVYAVALIYIAYALRAVRWKIFLEPDRLRGARPAWARRRIHPPVPDRPAAGFAFLFATGGLGGRANL